MNGPMAAPPRVTIITPTYNRARYLPETIESILEQGYPNLEYLVIDDGSTDDTAAVVGRYGERIRYHHQSNRGEAESVNRGWQLATGEYVCVVSSDDPQRPGLLRRSVEVMERHPDVLVTYPDWVILNEDSRPVLTIHVPDYSYAEMLTTCRCLPGPGTFMRRPALVHRITHLRDARYPLLSDFESWWRIGLLGPFLHIPEVLGAWRQHECAATVRLWRTRQMAEQHLNMAWDFFRERELPPHVRMLERTTKGAMLVAAETMVHGVHPWRGCSYLLRALPRTPKQALKALRGQYLLAWKAWLRSRTPAPLLRVYRLAKWVLRALTGGQRS